MTLEEFDSASFRKGDAVNYKDDIREVVRVNFDSRMIGLYHFGKKNNVEWVSYKYVEL